MRHLVIKSTEKGEKKKTGMFITNLINSYAIKRKRGRN